MVTKVSEEYTAPIFKADNDGSVSLQNEGNYFPGNTV
jgi:hypothetical protein